VPFYGAVIACADAPHLAAVLPRMTRRVTTYGLDAARCDVTASDIVLHPLGVQAIVKRRDKRPADAAPPATLGPLSLRVPGRHNLQNALAAVAVGLELGLTFERIASGLADFRGVERRFEVLGEPNDILVVDDYGHHPTEIAAALDAARVLKRRLIVAFQPHRYSRTAALMEAFGPALAEADHVVLTDIYAAGEDPIADVTLDALAAAIRRGTRSPVDVVPALDDLVPALLRIARPGDVVMTLGAGSIGSVSRRLIEALAANPSPGDGTKGAGA
jgi:UDP-N-acetylmuramate--alanine ligase